MKRVFVLGIDGAPPEYIFDKWRNELPNINRLIETGGYAKLISTIPPLSSIAWTSITTGKSPADIGIFEYIYRKNFDYDDWHIITSKNVNEKSIWEIASEYNKKSIVCFVNLTWPIKPFKGWMISDSLFGNNKERSDSVYPKELIKDLQKNFGEIPTPDIENFRNLTKEQVINETYKLAEKQIRVMKYLIKNKKWDLFFGIMGSSDRMNHTFLKFMDKKHRKYDENSKFKNTLKDFYKFIDLKLGELIDLLDKDTKIIVLSDHGIKRMDNRINLTDWLIKEGYLVLNQLVEGKNEFSMKMVDWEKTRVFAIGAYEGQIFINLKGREPKGIVKKEDYDSLIEELAEKLKYIQGDDGKILDTRIFRKKDFFMGKFEEIAPDLIIYFDNLQYGCNTSLINNESLWSPQTARGSDDAAHSQQGIFIIKNNLFKNKNLGEINAIDVAPIILNELDIEIPKDMYGKIINEHGE